MEHGAAAVHYSWDTGSRAEMFWKLIPAWIGVPFVNRLICCTMHAPCASTKPTLGSKECRVIGELHPAGVQEQETWKEVDVVLRVGSWESGGVVDKA